jgi:undecaprenyl pyrophosphate synthase
VKNRDIVDVLLDDIAELSDSEVEQIKKDMQLTDKEVERKIQEAFAYGEREAIKTKDKRSDNG